MRTQLRIFGIVAGVALLSGIATSARADVIPGQIEYSAHVSGVGWAGWTSDGRTAGTTGQSRAVEAIKLRFSGSLAAHYSIGIQPHVSGIGWMGWSGADGEQVAGTEGQSKQIEAFRIRLVKDQEGAPDVRLMYRAHNAKVGWGPWVAAEAGEDGKFAGVTGRSAQVEAFEIRFETPPARPAPPAPKPAPPAAAKWTLVPDSVEYSGHLSGVGWSGWARDGKTGGTTGQNRAVEAFKIRLVGEVAAALRIEAQAHVGGVGWMGWVAGDGEEVCGTQGQSKAIEAFRLKLVKVDDEVDMAKVRLVYRAHNAKKGWGAWVAADGSERFAGVTGQSAQLEAFEVRLEVLE